MTLNGAKAFITGGSGGLGRAICRELAGSGASIAVGYRSARDKADTLCRELSGAGTVANAVQIDIADADRIEDAVAEAADAIGAIDLLINNAGVALSGHDIAPGDLQALTPSIWDELMTINLRGPYLVTRAAVPYLRASNRGRVVLIGSTLGHGDWYMDRAFAPSKGAIQPLTRFLAASLAPDITVNCVAPGLMLGTGLGGSGGAYAEAWRDRAATGRTTDPADVARQVVSLCDSPSITGQTVVVDGGINFH